MSLYDEPTSIVTVRVCICSFGRIWGDKHKMTQHRSIVKYANTFSEAVQANKRGRPIMTRLLQTKHIPMTVVSTNGGLSSFNFIIIFSRQDNGRLRLQLRGWGEGGVTKGGVTMHTSYARVIFVLWWCYSPNKKWFTLVIVVILLTLAVMTQSIPPLVDPSRCGEWHTPSTHTSEGFRVVTLVTWELWHSVT